MIPTDRPLRLTRRALLCGSAAGLVTAALPGGARAAAAGAAGEGWVHAFSPLGSVRHPAAFRAFDYVNADAPKGGRMRLARMGAFDTVDTLGYRGRPPADIRLIYDRLFVEAADERASFYGLLARRFRVAEDFTRIDVLLDPAARWHDGRPVTAQDVRFTFETLKERGAPFYRQAFRPLDVVVEDEERVSILNARAGDRDVLRRLATIPIHPAHVWGEAETMDAGRLVGSGPYRVETVSAPGRLVLARVPDYWARDHAVNRGRWNFDRLEFEHHRDPAVALEAFRADKHDVRFEDDPIRWAGGYDGPALARGSILRSESPGRGSGTLVGLVFNLRRPVLARRGVRLALMLALDAEEMNRLLFSGAFERFASVFGESDLAARGAAGEAERAILEASGAVVGEDALADPDPLAGLPRPGSREALALASRLLDEAGLIVRDGVRIDPDRGEPLRLDVVAPDPATERPIAWLAREAALLGIEVRPRQMEPTAASRAMLDRSFDLAGLSWAPAELPGTAERLLWHSDLAEAPGSYALSGLADPAVDAAIEALERARSEEALQAAGRLFDRSFRHALAILPLWRANTVRLAWWDRFGRPAPREGVLPAPMERWWQDGAA